MPQAQETDLKTRSTLRYDSLVTHVQPGITSSRRTEIAAGLARRFGARLIGVGAELVEPIPVVAPYTGQLIGEVYAQLMEQVEVDLKSAAEAFDRDAAGVETEWRSYEAMPTASLIAAARAADLIVLGAQGPETNAYRFADIAQVMLQSGRPVLVAPLDPELLTAEKVVVAWKDTREARRAVHDALPFLVHATDVLLLAVTTEEDVAYAKEQVDDVALALKRRGAPARGLVVTAPDGSVAHELNAEAAAIGADLIVAGGYGHSRMAEWILGGATRDLLDRPQRYLLLSH
jgi:nucleotide-binding universal stress UspA family protein